MEPDSKWFLKENNLESIKEHIEVNVSSRVFLFCANTYKASSLRQTLYASFKVKGNPHFVPSTSVSNPIHMSNTISVCYILSFLRRFSNSLPLIPHLIITIKTSPVLSMTTFTITFRIFQFIGRTFGLPTVTHLNFL